MWEVSLPTTVWLEITQFKFPTNTNAFVILCSGILLTPNAAEGTAFHIGLILVTIFCSNVFVFE